MVAISPLDIFHSRIFWARRSSFSKQTQYRSKEKKKKEAKWIDFSLITPLCLISLEFYGEKVWERESWVRVRERETTAWGEWSLPPLIKLHPKPSSFFISTTHLSYLSRSTSVQFSSAQHSRSGMRILCVLFYFLHIFGFVTNGNFSFKVDRGRGCCFCLFLTREQERQRRRRYEEWKFFLFYIAVFFPLFLTNIFFHIVKRENSDSVDILDINHHSAAHVIIHYVLRNHL